MRILVCASYSPYPPVGGGRADIWRRIEAFVTLGHSVMLLHQYDPEGMITLTSDHLDAMDEVVQARYSYPVERGIRRSLRQVAGMWKTPWWVARAVPSSHRRVDADAAVRRFRPEAIWLDGPWLGELGQRYAAEFDAPIVYRSHNIEHIYLRKQARNSRSMRNRVAWALAAVGLRRYELRLMSNAQRVVDISLDDLSFWQRRGVARIRWLPPLPELALAAPPGERVPGEIVFVGGLSLPNNVEGLRWLVNEVLPLVRERVPEVTVSIVGYGAGPQLKAELDAHPGVRTFYDVPNVYPYLFGAKVLVNPVAVGSGVQLKMLDMLMTDAPIVTRAQGVRGLPPDCVRQVVVADDPQAFAAGILDRMQAGSVDLEAREKSRQSFTVAAVGDSIADLVPVSAGILAERESER